MKWLLSCCCLLLSVAGVEAGLPDTVDEIEIQIEYLAQQKILLKKRYQGDVVYQHRRLTQVSPNGTPKDQARVVQSNTSGHLSWLVQALAAIDQEILGLKKHKKTLMLKSRSRQPAAHAQPARAETAGQSLPIPVPSAAAPQNPYTVRILVPKRRVTWQRGQAFVKVLTEQGVESKPIQIGSDIGQDFLQVLRGLSLGDVLQ